MLSDLLSRARAGDAQAVTQIILEHQGVIRSYLARLAPDPVTADDLAQDVFLAALQSLDRIDPALGIRPYLLGIARNLARTAWRERLKGRRVSGDELFETLSEKLGPERPEERLAALGECLKRLPPKSAEVILRHYRDEDRCDEIAKDLGTAVSTVRSTLTRVRKALHECIQAKLARAAS
jgi:RNA polymerase sigma-70 factor (ECF subfamily)